MRQKVHKLQKEKDEKERQLHNKQSQLSKLQRYNLRLFVLQNC